MTLTVTPAYGRDYTSAKAALADWEAGKDFVVEGLHSGTYVSKSDLTNGETVRIRYNRKTRVVSVPR